MYNLGTNIFPAEQWLEVCQSLIFFDTLNSKQCKVYIVIIGPLSINIDNIFFLNADT